MTGALVFWGFRVLWTALVIAIPILGVWIGSSLATYLNGPIWLALVVGLLLFPGLPLAWEGWATLRRKKKLLGKRRRGVLTRWDRIVLRTFAINLMLVGGLLWRAPDTVFTALSGRGDWMLDPIQHPVAEGIRPWIFATADGFQWLFDAVHSNAYEDLIEDGTQESPEPSPTPSPTVRDGSTTPTDAGEPTRDSRERAAPPPPWAWPQEATLHPAVVSMPDTAKTSVRTVGQYLREQEPDPYRRAKAIHDFVADHVAYDGPAYVEGRYPPQDADNVLSSGVAVCAGYANLVKAIADVTGDTAIVVVGDARTRGGDISGEGHAWNAFNIEQRWYLVDATWDSGSLSGKTFTRDYGTDYLFVPPEIMGVTHFPDDPSWQLRANPISRGEFFRAPILRPRFYAEGFSLEHPTRSQVTVDRELEVRLGNPRDHHVLARYTTNPDAEGERCTVRNGETIRISCPLPSPGTYQVSLFGSPQEFGTYHFLGELQVNARG